MKAELQQIREALDAHLRSIRAVWSKADGSLRDDLEKLRGETFATLAALDKLEAQPPASTYENEIRRRARLAWEAGVGKRPDNLEQSFMCEVEKLIDFAIKREAHGKKPYITALGRQARSAEIYLNAMHEKYPNGLPMAQP